MSEQTNLADRPEYVPYNAEKNLSTLLIVSIPMLYGGDRFRLEAALMDDTGLLEAVESQTSTSIQSIGYLLEGMGVCLAIASESENMPRESIVSIGWGINFLMDLQEGLENTKSTAAYWLKTAGQKARLREKYEDLDVANSDEVAAFLKECLKVPSLYEDIARLVGEYKAKAEVAS